MFVMTKTGWLNLDCVVSADDESQPNLLLRDGRKVQAAQGAGEIIVSYLVPTESWEVLRAYGTGLSDSDAPWSSIEPVVAFAVMMTGQLVPYAAGDYEPVSEYDWALRRKGGEAVYLPGDCVFENEEKWLQATINKRKKLGQKLA